MRAETVWKIGLGVPFALTLHLYIDKFWIQFVFACLVFFIGKFVIDYLVGMHRIKNHMKKGE